LALKTAQDLSDAIRGEDKEARVAGPAPAPITRMRGYFRYNILLKGKDRTAMCALLRKVLGSFRKPHGVLIAVDVDPISM
jgi:primosomal protein N' (replication factor Y)